MSRFELVRAKMVKWLQFEARFILQPGHVQLGVVANPALHEPPDADQHWNGLSLPFVVRAHGRIGKLDPKALAP